VLSSVLIPLSAASPIIKGKLSSMEHQFFYFEAATDDRTPEERDPNSEKYVPKPRGGTNSYFLSDRKSFKDVYNDI